MQIEKEWFGEWFNSPYYHILYKDRDSTDAREFLDNLIEFLQINNKDKIMDLACGKGRHSIYLHNKGFNVVGLDLSPSNIEQACRNQSSLLQFFEHDMRKLYGENEFNYVLNMFTSFGYFDTMEENQLVITNIAKSLVQNGKLVLDFLNPDKVIGNLIPEEIKEKEGIEFHITKEIINDYIVKTIKFDHQNKQQVFHEKVKAIRMKEFLTYFKTAGLVVENIFGDYSLGEYDSTHSERMIFIVKK